MRTIGLLVMASCVFCGPLVKADQTPPGPPSPSVAEPVNRFAADLYPRLITGHGNLVCSPLSVYMALSMTAAGARGDTAREMSAVLQTPDASSPDAQTAAGDLLRRLQNSGQDFQLCIANAVWAQEGFQCLPPFRKIMQNDYGTDLLRVDFRAQQRACGTINDWVSNHTQGKISQLFSPGNLPPDTKMALVSAIYFKADWLSPFPPELTRDGGFHVAGSAETQPRKMMRTSGFFGFFQNDQFQALELPYKGGKIAMLILLPRSVDGLGKLEAGFSAKMVSDAAGGLRPAQVEATIPKFKFAVQVNLSAKLKDMGMPQAFEPNRSNFSGIDGQGDLFLSDAVHKAYISVDEQGTEAAAATGIVVMPTAVFANRRVFTADHPFLLVIRDRGTGAMLFVGRVEDPTGG
jgi:serine protease inhibitor